MKLRDLVGQRFGRLLVLERAHNRAGRAAWTCECECGNQTVVRRRRSRRTHSSPGRYSLDPSYYIPRCRRCHRQHDTASGLQLSKENRP